MCKKEIVLTLALQVGSLEVTPLSLTTSKKLFKPKNQQLFLRQSEKWGHRANHCPPYWIDRQTQRTTTSWSRHPQEKPPRDPAPGLKNWAGHSVRTSLRAVIFRGAQLKGVSTLPWVFPAEALPGPHREYQRKIPLYFWQRERGRNYSEICQSILFLTQSAYQSFICWVFNQSLAYQTEGKYPIPGPFSSSVPHGEKLRNTWSSQSKGTDSLKDWDLIRDHRMLPSPPPHHHMY